MRLLRYKIKGRRVAGRRDVCATVAPQGKAASKADTFVTAAFCSVAQSLVFQKTLRFFGSGHRVARTKRTVIIATCRACAGSRCRIAIFFVTCHVSRAKTWLSEREFECFAEVFADRRKELGFHLTAWVFLPNHWHAILYPAHPLTISRVVESIKVGSTLRINRMRSERGPLWQGRYFDRVMRTVKEYRETVEYIHWNPVKAGLVSRAEDWEWSSARDYREPRTGASGRMPVDSVNFSTDEWMRI